MEIVFGPVTLRYEREIASGFDLTLYSKCVRHLCSSQIFKGKLVFKSWLAVRSPPFIVIFENVQRFLISQEVFRKYAFFSTIRNADLKFREKKKKFIYHDER